MKYFSKEGNVISFDPPPSNLLGPRDYSIEFKEEGDQKGQSTVAYMGSMLSDIIVSMGGPN